MALSTTYTDAADAARTSADATAASTLGDGASAAALPDPGFGPSQRAAAIASFQKSASTVAHSLRLGADTALTVKDVVKDGSGAYHVRYTRTFKGLPVVGGDFVVHNPSDGLADITWDKAGRFSSLSTKPGISQDAALAAGSARGGTAELVVWAPNGNARLAYRTIATREHGLHTATIVDATTGRVIQSYSIEQEADAVGVGQTLYSGDVPVHGNSTAGGFELKDLSRGGHYVTTMNNTTTSESGVLTDADNNWGNNTASDPNTVAADAQYGAAETWDFYQTLGRDGIRDDGVGARSRVHYDTDYDNAFWSDDCFCMSYGDGSGPPDGFAPLVELDVAGHEMSHGVTSNSAGLQYFGESGGLNESTSDIMGTSVEFYANNANDPGDYYIGEEIAPTYPGGALRRMDHPSLDGGSYDCYTPLMGRDDVHYTSGVGNHFFYLLAQGTGSRTIGGLPHSSTSCNSTTFTGIGRTAAQKIWYRALTVYMVPGSDYQDARDATIRAARDLYGSTSLQCKRTQLVWSAVKVTPNLWGCPGLITPYNAPNAVTNPGFESTRVGAGWRANHALTDMVGAFGFQRSGTMHAYLRGYGSAGTDLLYHRVTVPAGNPKLTFYLLVDSNDDPSTAYDRFTAQIEVPGGAKTTVATSSNIKWDDSYHRITVSLSRWAGQSVFVKFFGTEDGSLQTGFLIDDVSVR